MKINNKICIVPLFLLAYVISSSFYFKDNKQNEQLTGAWQLDNSDYEQILLFADNYFSHTGYNKLSKKFEFTRGGSYEFKKDQLVTMIEFDTRQKDEVGKSINYKLSTQNNKLLLDINGKKETWKRLDEGREKLAGTWRITARKQDEKVVPILQIGPRKTIKILTANRFQWAAINPATKEFFGTGGGTYTFVNGKYTENIEFFSRDSTRVGASLSFNGKLDNGEWHHSGLSSKGDSIYEVWVRVK